MYEAFFGLREKPFSLLPDPSFLFLSQKHQEALTLLEYGLLNQAGFIVLTGEIGSGKTTLMRYLLNRLDSDVTVGLISHAHQSLGELMEWICLAFDIRVAGGSKLDQHQAFIDFVIDRYAKGKRVLLIVDEAQNLGVEKLEELRLLSNINADKDLVLQIMLLGQPQLRKLLHHSDLEQFVQRIAASYHLGRLTALETKNYIQHRIFVAGGKYEIFTKDACYAIHHYSNGVPRLINLICDTAMVYAYGGSDKRITGAAVDEFIASHAPHLLIQIERDDAGRPLPRERLHEEESEDSDDRTTTARTLAPTDGPQGDLIEDRKAESLTADDHRGLVMESPPVRAPDQLGTVSTLTQDEPISPTADAPHPKAVPLRPFESQGLEAGATVDHLPQGGSGSAVEAGPDLRSKVTGLPSNALVADQTTKRPPGQKRGRAIWLLLALVVIVATGISVLRVGWLSPSDQGGSAVTGRPQEDGSNDRNGAGGVDPADPKAAASNPGTDSPAKQVSRQELVSGTGPDRAAVMSDSRASRIADRDTPQASADGGAIGELARQPKALHPETENEGIGPVATLGESVQRPSNIAASDTSASIADKAPDRPEAASAPVAGTGSVAAQSPRGLDSGIGPDAGAASLSTLASGQSPQAVDGQVQAVQASAPAGPSQPVLSDRGTQPAMASDATSEAPIGPGSRSQTETLSSEVSAVAAAPEPRSALPTPAPVDSRTDGATDSRIADREAPRADGGGMGQLARQLTGLSLDVEKQDDRLVANLGRSVRFADGSAVLDASARDALKRIAELLKDPEHVEVRVIGHTDSSGSESLNQRLSDLRARVVVRYLAANGVSAARLTHQGRGKSEPKVAAEQEQVQGPEINRRIELELFEPDRAPD